MSYTSEVLKIEVTGHVATLWLNNPERRNAMGLAFWEDLPAMMKELSDDANVRAVVIAGKGPHFSSGIDLKAFAGTFMGDGGESRATESLKLFNNLKTMQQSISSVADCPKPVIAAIHGWCIGAGVDLITACDIRLATADALFSVRETRLGMVADLGTLQRLPGIIDRGHVAELVYTGKDINAARAKEIALVNEVYADAASLHAAAAALGAEIAASSPLAVQGCKAVLRFGEGDAVAQGLDYVALWNASFFKSNDLTEAMMAFMEKRTPTFTGS